MKTSRFSEQQIAFILKQAEDGTTVEEVGGVCGRGRNPTLRIWASDIPRLD